MRVTGCHGGAKARSFLLIADTYGINFADTWYLIPKAQGHRGTSYRGFLGNRGENGGERRGVFVDILGLEDILI